MQIKKFKFLVSDHIYNQQSNDNLHEIAYDYEVPNLCYHETK